MMLCHRRLIDDEQATQQRIFVSIGSASSGAEAAGVERSTRSDFLHPPSKPPYSVILRVPRGESRSFSLTNEALRNPRSVIPSDFSLPPSKPPYAVILRVPRGESRR